MAPGASGGVGGDAVAPGPTTASSSSSAAASHPDLSSNTPRNNGLIGTSSKSTASAALSTKTASAVTGLSNTTATGGIADSSIDASNGNNNNNQYPSSTSAVALQSLGANASPTDVLLTLPPPILRLLVVSQPFISFLTTLSQLLTWTHPNRFAPFFLPVLWTISCMGGEYILRYGLNGLLLGMLAIGWIVRKGAERRRLRGDSTIAIANKGVAATLDKNVSIAPGAGSVSSSSTTASTRENTSNVRTLALGTSSQPAIQVLTPSALNMLLAEATILSKHIQVLHRSFSPLLTPFTWKDIDLSWDTTYLLLNSYPYYLLTTYFVRPKLIMLILGLLVLFWEAPWFAVIRKSLWKSALVRRCVRTGMKLLYGEISLVKLEWNKGPRNVGFTRSRWTSFKNIWKQAKEEDLALLSSQQQSARRASTNLDNDIARGRSRSITGKTAASSKFEENTIEIQYLFSIFENQRWWIGLEWTQALLPNERPSWSDPTHAPCSPPGSFQLPASSTIYISSTHKRIFTWKWSDPKWRIRGTAGVLISPSTIGANPNPVNTSTSGNSSNGGVASGTAAATAASMGDKAAKDLKEVMGSLSDWKSILASKKNSNSEEKERRFSNPALAAIQGDEKGSATAAASSSSSSHGRKGSTSSFSLSALVGAKDGKPVMKDSPSSPTSIADAARRPSIDTGRGGNIDDKATNIDPTQDSDLLPGHPLRLDNNTSLIISDPESKNWEVDSQGWVYTDNQWEKPTSKGGMGRYTRRRAWVRRAVVVETVKEIDYNDMDEVEKARITAGRLGLDTSIPLKKTASKESKKLR